MSDGVFFRYLRMHLRDPVRRWSASEMNTLGFIIGLQSPLNNLDDIRR
jgi:hypothetical protein